MTQSDLLNALERNGHALRILPGDETLLRERDAINAQLSALAPEPRFRRPRGRGMSARAFMAGLSTGGSW